MTPEYDGSCAERHGDGYVIEWKGWTADRGQGRG